MVFHDIRTRFQHVWRGLTHAPDDPAAVLSSLNHVLNQSLVPQSMLPRLVETIANSLALGYVLLETTSESYAFGTAPIDPNHLVAMPLLHQGESVGLLSYAVSQPLNAARHQLLRDISLQTAAALHSIQLYTKMQRMSDDLQQARQRLVTAREEERRRLRRDLHDGLGPTLASLGMKVDAARLVLQTDVNRADALLANIANQTQETIAEIRRVVYDLRPPALDEFGLASAIREHAAQHSQHGITIVVHAPERLPALAAAVEVAAYRIVQEALTNVLRHSHATVCIVQLVLDANVLYVSVRDDGRGIATLHRPGVGLRGMRERAEELGGTCSIINRDDGGVEVTARLPLAA